MGDSGGCFEHVEAIWKAGPGFTELRGALLPALSQAGPTAFLPLHPPSPCPTPRLTAASLFSSGTAATPVPRTAGSGLGARRFLAGLGEKKE